MSRKPILSKSRIMAHRQCPRRLYLEVKQPGLRKISPTTEAAFRTGHEIGAVAQLLYGDDEAVSIPYEGGLQRARNCSRIALHQETPVTVFEATVQYDGVLIRADVMQPGRYGGWHLIEVKASTSVKPEHLFDVAIQAWVLRRAGYTLSDVSVAHVNNRFVYPGNGAFAGLLKGEPVDEDVEALLPSVPEWIADARRTLTASVQPDVAVGKRCYSPYECPFVGHCWPADRDYPVTGIGGRASREQMGEWIARGMTDVRDLPLSDLNDTQRWVQRVSQRGTAELRSGAVEFATGLPYPRYYLDFETAAPAVPLWPGTRPYQATAFQWSCHYEVAEKQLAHAEFLDLTGDMPARRFAESLIRVLGEEGPVIVYSAYEGRIIRDCIERFDDLRKPLESILERLTDLLPVAREFYYHPAMAGSWSIKSILPTVAADLDYAGLDGVNDGSAAAAAYLEAVAAETTAARKEEIRQQLSEYCARDSLGLVRLLRFFAG